MFLLRSLLSVLVVLICVSNSYCIVGGDKAAEGSLTYVVSFRSKETNTHGASGTILSNKWILTSMFFVRGTDPSAIYVMTGSNRLNCGGTRYEVSRIVQHSDYSAATRQNDIALVEIDGEITFDKKTQPITLATASPDVGTPCTLSGWGFRSCDSNKRAGNYLINNIVSLKATTISIDDCKAAWTGFEITFKQLCTIAVRGKGVFEGDVGGPLVNFNGEQIGIYAFGLHRYEGPPSVYTAVGEYIDWIEYNMSVL